MRLLQGFSALPGSGFLSHRGLWVTDLPNWLWKSGAPGCGGWEDAQGKDRCVLAPTLCLEDGLPGCLRLWLGPLWTLLNQLSLALCDGDLEVLLGCRGSTVGGRRRPLVLRCLLRSALVTERWLSG